MIRIRKLVELFFSRRVQGQFRHILSAVGGFIVAFGLYDEARTIAVIGLLISISGFIASWRAPEKQQAHHEIENESRYDER